MKALVETHPEAGMTIQRMIFNGKSYQEFIEEYNRKRDKERDRSEILAMHQLGIEVEKIALIKNVEKKYVEQVIKKANKELNGKNGAGMA